MKTWKKIGAALFAVIIVTAVFQPIVSKAEESSGARAARYFGYAANPSTLLPNAAISTYKYFTDTAGSFSCNITSAVKGQFSWSGCFAGLMQSIFLKGAAWVLWVSALFFDLTLDYSLNFKNIVDGIPIVNIGWGIIRDIANLFFIFVLLLASIGIILGNSKLGSKSTIPAVLVAALLINFSLFFTQVIIDVSNIAALQFYGQIRGNPSATPGSTNANPGVAAAFMNALDLSTIFKAGSNTSSNVGNDIASQSGGGMSAWNIIIVSVGGGILILITAFVFLTAALMFVYRSVVLVFLLTLSPIAFIGSAIPSKQLAGLSSKWWDTLTKQAIFAPAYMAMTYIVIAALLKGTQSANGGNFAALFRGDASAIGTAFSFIMIIAYMVGTLGLAVSLGAAGSGFGSSMANKLKSWSTDGFKNVARKTGGVALRSTVGLAANRFADSNALRNIVANRRPGAQFLKNFTDKTAASKFGLSKSFNDRVKAKIEQEESMYKFATGSQTIMRKGLNESDADFAKREADNAEFKAKAKERANAFATGLATSTEIPFSGGRQGATMALQSRTIRDRVVGSKTTAEADLDQIKVAQIQALNKVIAGDKAEAQLRIDGKEITTENVSKLTVQMVQNFKKDHEDRMKDIEERRKEGGVSEGEKLLDGDLHKLEQEIAGIQGSLDKIKFGKVGERQKLTAQLQDAFVRRGNLVAKKDNHFDRIIQVVQKTEEKK